MRIFILTIFLLLAAAPSVVAQQRPPNIIVILSDDHTRQAISAYGIQIPDATFKLVVDLVSYVLMGYAVYTNHDEGGTDTNA